MSTPLAFGNVSASNSACLGNRARLSLVRACGPVVNKRPFEPQHEPPPPGDYFYEGLDLSQLGCEVGSETYSIPNALAECAQYSSMQPSALPIVPHVPDGQVELLSEKTRGQWDMTS